MKRKRIMVNIGVVLLMLMLAAPITTLAAPGEVNETVTIKGSGTIGLPAKPDPDRRIASGVGTVSRISRASGPKTGDWTEAYLYSIVFLSGLAVMLLLLLLKWNRKERWKLHQKY